MAKYEYCQNCSNDPAPNEPICEHGFCKPCHTEQRESEDSTIECDKEKFPCRYTG